MLPGNEEFIHLFDGTHTMQPIAPSSKPKDRACSYYNPQFKLKIKEDKPVYRVRGTYVGNIIVFTGLCCSGTTDLQTVKLPLSPRERS